MKLGLDFHGVIDDKPAIFGQIIEALGTAGNYIYIISGPPTYRIRNEIADLGLSPVADKYCKIYSIIDYLQECSAKLWQDDNGNWWASDEDWWSSKAFICKGLGIHLMVDDSERYELYFRNISTTFLLYKYKERRTK